MPGTRSTNAGPVAGVLLILALLVVSAACGAVGAAAPSPSVPASPTPTAEPTAAPSVVPSEVPSGGAIDLDIVDESDVSVVIVDKGGALSGARSGRAGDGMSVRWFDVVIENIDEDTLRVTWVGLPVDAAISLDVAAKGDGYVLAFAQPAPPEHSDAMGFDRVLELDFAEPVDAGDVEAAFTTAG